VTDNHEAAEAQALANSGGLFHAEGHHIVMVAQPGPVDSGHFRHPFLHNEMVVPQVSMGEHSIHINLRKCQI
jgi:hypothetical protein